jgi:hypothetical protein
MLADEIEALKDIKMMSNEETNRVIQTLPDPAPLVLEQVSPPTLKKEGDPHHWWREPISGLLSVIIALVDIWYFGKDKGLSAPLDELILVTGLALIAGIRNLFTPPGRSPPPK